MNNDFDKNIDMLNKILYEHSLMDGCKNKFSKSIYVISDNTNKLNFKNMFDKNPYLYFTEIKISSKLTSNTLKQIKANGKQTIFIIDGSIDTHIIINMLEQLKSLNIHLLYLTSNYSITLYKKLKNLSKKPLFLLHNNSKNISEEKKFFKNIVDKLYIHLKFDNYFNSLDNIMINDYFIRYF